MLAFAQEVMVLVVSIVLVQIIGLIVLLVKCYKMPSQGQALIRSGFKGNVVSFSGKIVIPFLHKVQYLDITLKRIVIDRQGSEALTCKDGIRIDVKTAFFVRVNSTPQDVLKVAGALGIEGAANIETLTDLFGTRFLTGLETVAKANTFEQLSDREYFKSEVMQTIGNDLDGYILDTAAIDYLEKTQTA